MKRFSDGYNDIILASLQEGQIILMVNVHGRAVGSDDCQESSLTLGRPSRRSLFLIAIFSCMIIYKTSKI